MSAIHPKITALIQQHTDNMSLNPTEAMLQGYIFDIRRSLIHDIMEQLTQTSAQEEDTKNNTEDNLARQDALEDMLRTSLPPLVMPSIARIPSFSAWRTSLLAILGLLLGSAIGQILVQLNIGMGAGIVVLCGVLGIMALLSLAEYCVQAMSQGSLSFPSFARANNTVKKHFAWKKVRRYARWTWGIVLLLTIVRDFFGGREVLAQGLHALELFFTTGNVLHMFGNMYIILLFCACFALLLHRPLHFDRAGFISALEPAAQNWWQASLNNATLLLENMTLKENAKQRPLEQVGADLYSFAAELPSVRRMWLEERLRRLGLESVQDHTDQGVLVWHTDMQELYTPLGHINVGDTCFVDEAPLMADGTLVRKGTVRKVRR